MLGSLLELSLFVILRPLRDFLVLKGIQTFLVENCLVLRNVIQAIETPEGIEGTPNLAERRRILRVRSYFPVVLDVDGQQFRGTVTDIGVEGIKLKSPQATFTAGQTFVVHCANSAPGFEFGGVQCQVLWIKPAGRDNIVGCRYADTREKMLRSWVRYVLQELGFDETSTYQRRRLAEQRAIPARVRHNGQNVLSDARVTSLGIGGALLESRDELPPGVQVDLEMSLWRILPTLAVTAQVLEVREDPTTRTYLHSMHFGVLQGAQIRLLGNYVINQINQTSA